MKKIRCRLMLGLGACLLGLGACTDEGGAGVPVPEATAPVQVTLSLQSASMEGQAEVRATAPRLPDVENLIYDVWILQFTDEGNFALLAPNYQHLRGDAQSGTTALTATVSLLPLPSYICVVANRNVGNTTQNFGAIFDEGTEVALYETFEAFTGALVTLDIETLNSSRTGEGAMLMCGYWQGTPSESQSLNVTLSRMMARLNVTIENKTGVKLNNTKALTVEVQNVPKQAYLFPSVESDSLPSTAYTTLRDEGVTISSGSSKSLYYYVAPNFCGSGTYATKILITNGNKQRAEIVLGTDAPGTSNRDLNLYHNTIYNYTITLSKN